MGRLACGFRTPLKLKKILLHGVEMVCITSGWVEKFFLGTIIANFGYYSRNLNFPEFDSLQPIELHFLCVVLNSVQNGKNRFVFQQKLEKKHFVGN